MANLVSTAFESEYAFYERMHGAAWYELAGNRLVRNPHYPDVPSVQEIKSPAPLLPALGIVSSLYDMVGNTVIPDMLNHPENYSTTFTDVSRVFFNDGGLQ